MPVRERQEVQALSRPHRVARNRLAGAAIVGGSAAAITSLGMLGPDALPVPSCPFRAATGLLCPFCGGTRALHALLHGDVSSAAAFNPIIFLLAPALAALVIWLVIPLIRGRPIRPVSIPRPAWAGIAMVLASLWVLRNIPDLWPLQIRA